MEAKQRSAWMEILCMPSEKGKARRATGLNAGNKRSLINEDSMCHNTDACQLSQSEKRILAEAELISQRKRLHELRQQCMDAERRMVVYWHAAAVLTFVVTW